MALLQPTDIQSSLNIDLTDLNGQALTTSLIASATSWVSGYVGYPIEAAPTTEYFGDGQGRLWLSTLAPVSNLVLSQYNSITNAYDALEGLYVRNTGTNEVYTTVPLIEGFQGVKASYTTGWDSATLPADLRQALIDIVGLKLQAVTNYSTNPDNPAGDGSAIPTGALKRVSAGSYSEEYATGASEAAWKAKATQLAQTVGDGLPAGIMSTLERYRRLFAI